jgi:hypothetical protein
MKKNVLVFGFLSGIIVSTFMAVSMLFYKSNPDFEGGMLIGYASMIIAFSFIFVGIKNFRDKYNNGFITFGKAFKIGILIALIASTCYVIVWSFEYHFVMPDFMEAYTNSMTNKLKSSGASEAAINAQMAKMVRYREMYKNPVFFALFTYMEILPVGLIMTLIAALILKKKNNDQPQTA